MQDFHPRITNDVLLAAGYRRYEVDQVGAIAITFNRTVRAFALGPEFPRSLDGPPCYVVSFFAWDLAFLPRGRQHSVADRYLSTEANMRLVDGHRFCVDYKLDDTTTLVDVETFYARVYFGLGCLPDPEAASSLR